MRNKQETCWECGSRAARWCSPDDALCWVPEGGEKWQAVKDVRTVVGPGASLLFCTGCHAFTVRSKPLWSPGLREFLGL